MSNNFYNILEVNPRASAEVVKASCNALIKKYKTDEDKLKFVKDAKAIICNEKKRQEYDDSLTQIDGKIIDGKYRIVRTIAKGGFGTTYEAEHIINKMPVCIKHAHNVSPQDEEIIMEEAKSIWDLRHYGLPVMRDMIKFEDGSFALVMGYVKGPTLAQIIEKEKFIDPEHVAWITERVLNTLKYLHFNGIVHGDIKPHNIIIQPEIHGVTLVDFGLAMIKPKAGSANKGYTPLFASPEHLSGKVLLPESDFYSLGLTMIFCLGGDVKTLRVPSTTPVGMRQFIKNFIRKGVLSRPSWEKEDLCQTIIEMRKSDFGRSYSNMKPLDTTWFENVK